MAQHQRKRKQSRTEVGSNINIVKKKGTIKCYKLRNDDWGKPVYTVTFNSNSGLRCIKKAAAKIQLLHPRRKKNAYTFLAGIAKDWWYKSSNPYKVYGPVTLYARGR